jgi:hypothetical protein
VPFEPIIDINIVHALDRALIDLLTSIRSPSVYKAGAWYIKVTSFGGYSTAVLPAPESVADRLNACLTAYRAATRNREYKRVFRDEFDSLWVCECSHEN